MSNIDYEYKSTILKTDLCKRINAIDKKRFLNSINGVVNDPILDNEEFDLVLDFGSKAVNEARKINKALYYRYKRLDKRISDMLLTGHCIFCTFNFSDEVLASTSAETRRRYVARHLKQFNAPYVANIDFGSNRVYKDRKGNERQATSREHYHALICIDELPRTWQYGYDYLKHVRVAKTSSKKLAKYISKLTNHGIKESTKRQALLYSRSR